MGNIQKQVIKYVRQFRYRDPFWVLRNFKEQIPLLRKCMILVGKHESVEKTNPFIRNQKKSSSRKKNHTRRTQTLSTHTKHTHKAHTLTGTQIYIYIYIRLSYIYIYETWF